MKKILRSWVEEAFYCFISNMKTKTPCKLIGRMFGRNAVAGIKHAAIPVMIMNS